MRFQASPFALIFCALAFPFAATAEVPAGSMPTGPVTPLNGQPVSTWVIPNGRLLRPAGEWMKTGLFPLGLSLTPNGNQAVVVCNGYGAQSVELYHCSPIGREDSVPERTVFNGVAVAPNGKDVFVCGGGSQTIFHYRLADGMLKPDGTIPCPGYPSGIAFTDKDKEIAVTCNLARRVRFIDWRTGKNVATIEVGTFPFAIANSPDGHHVLVTNWGDDTVSVIDPLHHTLISTIEVGIRPTAVCFSPRGHRAYVANANNDTLSIIDMRREKVARTIAVHPYPHSPNGSSPTAVAVSPDGNTLYVTLAGNNAVAAYSTRNHHLIGMEPTAWYPTAIAVERDGRHAVILCAKGLDTGPNTNGQYIGNMMFGVIERISLAPSDFVKGLAEVARLNGFSNSRMADLLHHNNDRRGLPRGITHCVFIVRENRTYDQDLGDYPAGNGDPALAMFGEEVTPNLHALAARFAIGDNFYSDGEVSAQGHQWTLGANCPDYVEKTWMAYYSSRGRIWDSTTAPISYPAIGYMMDVCVRHHISCRMYGDEVEIRPGGKPIPSMANIRCPNFKGFDLSYLDTNRVAAWLKEFKAGIFPQFTYIWLPDDHTAGTRIGMLTPRSLVANNDLATGEVIDAISHSRYWKHTAIFITEDDSQDGRDHVDAHRNLLLVVSPWLKPGIVTHHHYSFVSIYATIERLLKMPPLSQYDDLADPITDIWSSTPDLTPYNAVPEKVPMNLRNGPHSPAAKESSLLKLSKPDENQNGLLEKILWQDYVER